MIRNAIMAALEMRQGARFTLRGRQYTFAGGGCTHGADSNGDYMDIYVFPDARTRKLIRIRRDSKLSIDSANENVASPPYLPFPN
jgi:hypothetical protein